jgi:anti-anti-sigma regulatory factor
MNGPAPRKSDRPASGGPHRAYFPVMDSGTGGTVPRTLSVDRMASGDHACLGFDDDEARWEIRAAFTEIGLHRGERVIFFTDPATTPEETVNRLSELGVRAERALALGSLVIVNETPGHDPAAAAGFDPAARAATWVGATDTAHRQGFPGIRAVGDMSWVLDGVDHDSLVAYEAACTQVFADIGFTVICEYDRRRFAPDLLGRVSAAHPTSVLQRLDALHVEHADGALMMSGDADLATRSEFEFGLREAFAAPAGPPRLIDLSELSFIDAHCAALLVRHTAALDRSARVILRCPPLHARTLRLCGATEVPQLLVIEG